MDPSLVEWGWTADRATGIDPGTAVGRVVAEHRGHYDLVTGGGRVDAVTVTPVLRRSVDVADDYPAVGDWVTLDDGGAAAGAKDDADAGRGDRDGAAVARRLPRTSAVVRRAAGPVPEPQTLAANVDTVFVVTSATDEFNLRRVERHLAMVLADDVVPVVVLTKVDGGTDPRAVLDELRTVTGDDIETVAVSNLTGDGYEHLSRWLRPRTTTALVGSSGVGKSSLVNRLMGRDVQHVAEVRGDERGRHTTIRRELIALPGGALVIDTPGIREVRLWRREGLDAAFPDVADVATRCRFGDCAHRGEPGCAVQAALDDGSVSPARVDDYLALSAELDETEDQLERRRRS